ncbi:MAG: hypothetical protein AAF197_10580, partial [Pseudomonadota bacterium]
FLHVYHQRILSEKNKMKIASMICIILLIAWVFIAIVDMWFDIVSGAIFIKVTITFGLLMVLALAIALARREYMQESEMRKDKYID